MATVKEITMGITSSVKVDKFQYVKPQVAITVMVDPTEDYDEALAILRTEVKERMAELITDIKDEYDMA